MELFKIRFKKGNKYKPHQGKNERKRRLRQVAYDKLDDTVVTPEARKASRVISNWVK